MSGIPEDEKLNMETELICKILIEEKFSEIKYTYVYIIFIYLFIKRTYLGKLSRNYQHWYVFK